MEFITKELTLLKEKGLYRKLRPLGGRQGVRMEYEGREILLFSSNDYLGLASNEKVQEAAKKAIDQFGCGAGASRLVSGTMLLHEELERKIASFKKKESALLFTSGFMANLGILQAVAERGDIIISDRLNHASLLQGAALSGAKLKRYLHKDMKSLEKILASAQGYKKRIIVTDGLFSMDGDLAPLPAITDLAQKYDAITMVDDAHGTGVFGENGRGVAEHFGVEDKIDIHMGTLSKGIGSLGGFMAGSSELRELIINKGGSFIYTTAPPPPILAASIAAIDIIQNEPLLRRSLREKYTFLRKELNRIGFNTMDSESQIIPILIGETSKAMEISKTLMDEGFLVPAIRPPTVPQGQSRLRLSLSAAHSDRDIDDLIAALQRVGKKTGNI
ncbi:MAG: 8-amino-7-oxononanoate synthase [Nitrospinota bacterium]|nr:8-amino-7-oxononanoate synthase [Nitrospinota bacterium]